MTPDEAQQIAAASLMVTGVSLLVAIGVYVWYALMLAKVFAQFGQPAWSAWVPVYNEMQVFRIGGQQPWLALLLYVPLAQVVGLVFKVFALHRISKQSWRGVGTTVLGVLLPAVWATVLALGPSPDPERGRMPRGPVTGPIPPVQPGGPLANPYAAAQPAAPGATPLPGWLVPGAAAVAAPAAAVAEPVAPPAPVQSVQAAPAPTANAQATPLPAAPDPASSPFAPPSAFAAAEPQRVPGRIEPLPPMPGSAPTPTPAPEPDQHWVQAQQPVPAQPLAPAQPVAPATPRAPVYGTVPNPFIAPQHTEASVPQPLVPASFAPAPPGAQAVATPLGAFEVDSDETVVTGNDDPFDRTVVVDRRPAFEWRLLLGDGTALPLEAPTMLLGRNPRSGDAGERSLVVPDPSRTLSKTHAMIHFDGQQWWITDLDSTNGVLLADGSGTDHFVEVGVPTPFSGRFVLGTLEVRIEPDPHAAEALR
ncbi:DUF5684 domain-containing protein [Agromyces sp. Marseille-Q5079]|uniref:DUF5684 domain-containing protein n=1 Tax=Agromyces sp. Marseille-Q5079 TaxID=3439059 RepID=UPI003D9CA966